jgi:hypothetical protein
VVAVDIAAGVIIDVIPVNVVTTSVATGEVAGVDRFRPLASLCLSGKI